MHLTQQKSFFFSLSQTVKKIANIFKVGSKEFCSGKQKADSCCFCYKNYYYKLLSCSRKYSFLPHRRDFLCTRLPLPLWKFQFSFTHVCSFVFLGPSGPNPPDISNAFTKWRRYTVFFVRKQNVTGNTCYNRKAPCHLQNQGTWNVLHVFCCRGIEVGSLKNELFVQLVPRLSPNNFPVFGGCSLCLEKSYKLIHA